MELVLPYILGAAASAATLLGGFITLRLKRLNIVLGLSAGIVLGVALFELIPEALRLVPPQAAHQILSMVGLGLIGYFLLDRSLAALSERGASLRRQIGPASLIVHSLMDGAGIGLAFQLSTEIGWGVAFAVFSHDIADGINIVGLSLKDGDRRVARNWLLVNGAAPLVGVAAGQMIGMSYAVIVPALSALAGVFLYIGASQLLPRSYGLGKIVATTAASLFGFAIVYAVTRIHG